MEPIEAAVILWGAVVFTGVNDAGPGNVVKGNENEVLVSNVFTRSQAKSKANAHCNKYGKEAVYEKRGATTVYYKCQLGINED